MLSVRVSGITRRTHRQTSIGWSSFFCVFVAASFSGFEVYWGFGFGDGRSHYGRGVSIAGSTFAREQLAFQSAASRLSSKDYLYPCGPRSQRTCLDPLPWGPKSQNSRVTPRRPRFWGARDPPGGPRRAPKSRKIGADGKAPLDFCDFCPF